MSNLEGTLYWNRGTAAYSCYGGGIPDRLDDYGICYWDSSSYSSFDSCSYTYTKKGREGRYSRYDQALLYMKKTDILKNNKKGNNTKN